MFGWILVLTLCNAEGKCGPQQPIARATTFEQCDVVADAYIATADQLPKGFTGTLDCLNTRKGTKS